MDRTITIRIKGTWLRYLVVVAITALVAIPATVLASNTFTGVADGNIFHDDIDWMADTGVTLGCGNGEYCSGDNVTRQQMAAFMHRLADNQVVEGFTVSELAPRAAYDSSTNLDDTDGTALTATITAPADGYEPASVIRRRRDVPFQRRSERRRVLRSMSTMVYGSPRSRRCPSKWAGTDSTYDTSCSGDSLSRCSRSVPTTSTSA